MDAKQIKLKRFVYIRNKVKKDLTEQEQYYIDTHDEDNREHISKLLRRL